jgi:hypothetical protein
VLPANFTETPTNGSFFVLKTLPVTLLFCANEKEIDNREISRII